MPELDRERIERMTEPILVVVRDNYLAGPTSPDRTFEALNALAMSIAFVIQGADGPGGNAHRFFDRALEKSLSDLGREMERSRNQ